MKATRTALICCAIGLTVLLIYLLTVSVPGLRRAYYRTPSARSLDPLRVPPPLVAFNERIEYHPESALLPDPKLTPGDVFADASADDICTPG